MEFSHFDNKGNAVMVDVTQKEETERIAIAEGTIKVNETILNKIKEGTMGKGDVLNVARIAGIMSAKKTFELIPMCHIILLTKCSVDFEIDENKKETKHEISTLNDIYNFSKELADIIEFYDKK